LFQEIPLAVHATIEDFSAKHPSFEMLVLASRIAGLDACVKDFLAATAKKSSFFLYLFIIIFTYFFC